MGHEIPRNLTRYAEEFLFGLSLKQFIYAGSSVGICFLLYMWFGSLTKKWIIFLAMIPFLAVGTALVFFDLEGKVRGKLNLKNSLYRTSYFDSSVKSFIDVDDIKEDMVILKRGMYLGIIEVKPVDFFILGGDEREKLLDAYRSWLKSIDYYVQILSRSVSADLELWIDNIKKKAPEDSKERVEIFSGWINEEMSKSNIRNRKFYIVIPEKSKIKRRSFYEEIKSIFTGDYGISFNDSQLEEVKISLRNNIINCREILERCGIKTRRLETDELLGLYSSYFTNQSKINKTILSPFVELDKDSLKKQDVYYEKIKSLVAEKKGVVN